MPDSNFSEEWLERECNRICAKAATIRSPQDRRRYIVDEIAKLNVSSTLKLALENMMSVREIAVAEGLSKNEKMLGFGFGVVFVAVLLVIAFKVPNPTPFQYFVFRAVLALAAAGVGGVFSGFLAVVFGSDSRPWLQAGGALALFVVTYLVNPARLVAQ